MTLIVNDRLTGPRDTTEQSLTLSVSVLELGEAPEREGRPEEVRLRGRDGDQVGAGGGPPAGERQGHQAFVAGNNSLGKIQL